MFVVMVTMQENACILTFFSLNFIYFLHTFLHLSLHEWRLKKNNFKVQWGFKSLHKRINFMFSGALNRYVSVK